MPGPKITPLENGPLKLDLPQESASSLISNSLGKTFEEPRPALCRCGGSNNKPFCDGTHIKNGFTSKKETDGKANKRDTYEGNTISIHDNRSICAHAGFCTDRLSKVFKLKEEPWIDPNGADVEEIKKAVARCPSGALSSSLSDDLKPPPHILVTPNGPYAITGSVSLENTEFGDHASKEHYTLCRCGGSKNKPFCDGTHWHIGFKDEKN